MAEDSGIPLSGFRDSVQDSGIPGFQDSEILGFQDSGIPGFQKKRPLYSKYSTETRIKKVSDSTEILAKKEADSKIIFYHRNRYNVQ